MIILPDPHTASYCCTTWQMYSSAQVFMGHLLQTKCIFPHCSKSQFKAGCSHWSPWEIFFPPINFSRDWDGPVEIVCCRKILTCSLGLSRKKPHEEWFIFTDYAHSPNNLKLIPQFHFKLLCCCAWLLKKKRFQGKQHRWITFAQCFQH